MKTDNAPNPQFVRRIAVDDRERRSGVPAALAKHPDVEVTIRRLPLGDYFIDKTLIVERKTLSDFALSVRDGRLFPQFSRLVRSNRERPCLILEGTRKRYQKLAISRSAFQGALITVTMVFGLPVLRSRGPDETAQLMVYAADQLQRTTVRPPRRCGFKTTTVRRHQLYLMQAIPEIGGLRAELLLDAFGSPARIAEASIESLRTVNGIGERAAARIHQVFHAVGRQM